MWDIEQRAPACWPSLRVRGCRRADFHGRVLDFRRTSFRFVSAGVLNEVAFRRQLVVSSDYSAP